MQMCSITLNLIRRNNVRAISIEFSFNDEIVHFLKMHKGKWDPFNRYWWTRDLKNLPNAIESQFPNCVLYSLEFLLWKLGRELIVRNYSRKTIKSYLGQTRQFFNWAIDSRDILAYRAIDDNKISQYLEYCHFEKNLSSASLRTIIQALRYFWKEGLQRNFPPKVIYPRKESILPAILSKKEVLLLIDSLDNYKHKLLLMLAYSSGLRVSEIVSLRKNNIDFYRQVIHIQQGKGKKDRMVPLSKKFTALWREHHTSVLKEGNDYIFPGQYPNTHLATRTAEKIFENAKKNSNISKNVSFHSLRHAFATHLLEAGTGIRHIQALLGHANVRTTERYARLSKVEIQKVPSPLDLEI
jgi:integrase/recombinase XerD